MSNLVKIIIIGVLIIAIPVTVKLVQQQQTLKSKASEGIVVGAGCLAGHSAGSSWNECRGCDEGVTTCGDDDNYYFASVNPNSPNCGASCGGGTTPAAPAGGATPVQGAPSTTKYVGGDGSSCKVPTQNGPNPKCSDPLPNSSFFWKVIDPSSGYPLDAGKYGIGSGGQANQCGGANAAAANAVCPQNTTDSANVKASTSNWCYEFTEGNRCIQLHHTGTDGSGSGGTGNNLPSSANKMPSNAQEYTIVINYLNSHLDYNAYWKEWATQLHPDMADLSNPQQLAIAASQGRSESERVWLYFGGNWDSYYGRNPGDSWEGSVQKLGADVLALATAGGGSGGGAPNLTPSSSSVPATIRSATFNGKDLNLTGATTLSTSLVLQSGAPFAIVPVVVNYSSGSPSYLSIKFNYQPDPSNRVSGDADDNSCVNNNDLAQWTKEAGGDCHRCTAWTSGVTPPTRKFAEDYSIWYDAFAAAKTLCGAASVPNCTTNACQ